MLSNVVTLKDARRHRRTPASVCSRAEATNLLDLRNPAVCRIRLEWIIRGVYRYLGVNYTLFLHGCSTGWIADSRRSPTVDASIVQCNKEASPFVWGQVRTSPDEVSTIQTFVKGPTATDRSHVSDRGLFGGGGFSGTELLPDSPVT